MPNETGKSAACPVCNSTLPHAEMMPLELIADPVLEFIRTRHPEIASQDAVCLSCLNKMRAEYVEALLSKERGELSAVETDVVSSMHEQELLSRNINLEFDQNLTLGQRVADKTAEVAGSWRFIGIFGGVLVLWLLINSALLLRHPFDPFPYILLNLILSCLAAIQAPVIMMSQNRQNQKDRLQADHDYRTNLKAELEIRQLNWKVDQLLMHHWQRLLEIQQIQTELMEQMVQGKSPRGDDKEDKLRTDG